MSKFGVICLVLTVLSIAEALFGIGRSQEITVEGTLTCDGRPEQGTLVKMYDDNTFMPDSKLGQARTGPDGRFYMRGQINNIFRMDPKVNIYTRCHVGAIRCPRKVVIKLPNSAINSQQVQSIGHIELANKFPGESHDCIHK